MNKWDACAFKVDEDDLEGRVCYGGLDLSSTTDITAFVLVFPPMDADDKYAVLPHFWIPEDNIDLRVRRDHVPYDLWERQGYLQTTEGNVVHYGFIEKYIERLGERFNIREIAFDCWGAVSLKGLALRRDGAESRRYGFYRCSLRAGLCVHVTSHQGTDEAGLGAENRPRRASRPALEHGQHLHSHRPCREHQGR